MKTKFFAIAMFMFIAQFANAGSPFYYESISNPLKTIDYVFGFYHTIYSVSTASDNKEYVAITGAVINNADYELKWGNYYVAVLLKNGSLVFNYKTAATSGDYANFFTVAAKKTQFTKFCFHTVFKPDDIQAVFIFDKDNMKTFSLAYSKNE
jgi:hypothetical protein